MTERVIERREPEYKKFQFVATALELDSKHNARYIVDETYLDFGQDWLWTTIIRKGFSECQILNPRQWKEIMLAKRTEDLVKVVRNIQNGTYFGDN